LPDLVAGWSEVRADHHTDGRRPDHKGQIAPAGAISSQVDGGESGLQVHSAARSEQSEADQKQRHAVHGCSCDDTDSTDRGGECSERKRRSPAGYSGESRQRNRERSCPKSGHRCCQPGERVLMRNRHHKQRAERQRRPHADAAKNLASGEHDEHSPLNTVRCDDGARTLA
jgi:hypothetical protein